MSDRQHHIMVVGAHCGDAEVMAGGIVAKYTRNGHKASIVHLTAGEKGHRTLPPEEYAEQKRREAQAAAEVLGADVYFLPYKDAELPVNDEVIYQLADLIRQVKPTIILTHWKESIHKDHTNTSLIAEDARFYAALPAIKRELPAHGAWGFFYCENWEDPYGYEPDIYVDISEVFDVYVEAMQQYELFRGGVSSFRYIDYYKALAVMRGCLANCQYAQTLMRPRGANVQKGPAIPGYPL
jgi:N-acetylglucosamine malate deacetylase 1